MVRDKDVKVKWGRVVRVLEDKDKKFKLVMENRESDGRFIKERRGGRERYDEKDGQGKRS